MRFQHGTQGELFDDPNKDRMLKPKVAVMQGGFGDHWGELTDKYLCEHIIDFLQAESEPVSFNDICKNTGISNEEEVKLKWNLQKLEIYGRIVPRPGRCYTIHPENK